MSIIYCHKHDNHYDSDLETDCVECDEDCDMCKGTGTVRGDEYDHDSHSWQIGVGNEMPCACNYKS